MAWWCTLQVEGGAQGKSSVKAPRTCDRHDGQSSMKRGEVLDGLWRDGEAFVAAGVHRGDDERHGNGTRFSIGSSACGSTLLTVSRGHAGDKCRQSEHKMQVLSH